MKRLGAFAYLVTILFITIGCRSIETSSAMTDTATLQKSTHTAQQPEVTATPVPTPIAESFNDGQRVTYIWNAGFLIGDSYES